jgi:hypothetical protein
LHELVEELEHGRMAIGAVVQVLQIVIQFWMMPVNEVLKRELYVIRKTFVPWGCFVGGATKGTDRAETVRLRIHRIDRGVISCARNLSRDPVMWVGNDFASSGHDLVVQRFGHEALQGKEHSTECVSR